jgi:FkbM family methyltransferase
MSGGVLARPLTALLRRYPFFSGGASLVARGPFPRLAPPGPVATARLRDGARLRVHPGDFIGRAILLTGDYDPKITWLCRQVLRPGDTVLDIGANHGIVSAYAAGLVGPSGAVHAFEPQRDLADLLAASMKLNGYRQVTVHALALSDTDGVLALHGTRANAPMVSLGGGEHGEHGEDEILDTVPVRRGDTLFAELGLRPIRLLKVDIEGHEEAFLAGSLSYLSQNRPDVIAFESHGSAPFRRRPVVAMLSDLGYELFQIPKAMLRMRLTPVRGDRTGRGFDFVAVSPDTGLAARLT